MALYAEIKDVKLPFSTVSLVRGCPKLILPVAGIAFSWYILSFREMLVQARTSWSRMMEI